MSIIAWVILGLIAGFIGSKIVNRQNERLMLDIALGIVGAIVNGVLFHLFGASSVTGLNLCRRRRWSRAEKERIVAAAMEPGAVASEVARAAGVHTSQLFHRRGNRRSD